MVRDGISAAGASQLVGRALRSRAIDRDIGGRSPVVVAAGKAAAEMASSFASAVSGAGASGLVASPNPGTPTRDLEWFDVGHPVPTEGSVAAGRRALELAAGLSPDEVMVLLLSGGASAGLAAPLAGLTLADKSAATSVLLRSGVAIDGLNCVRKHLSALKGGRLALAARGRIVTLAISDVVDPTPDDPAVIGSGPTTPDPTTFAEALEICRAASAAGNLPPAVLDTLERGARGELEESPKPDDSRLAGAAFHLIGSRRDAVEGAAEKARELGYSVSIIDEPVTGEARRAGEDYVRTIARQAYEQPRPLCIVSAGETTVRVTGNGRGGRNQEFALASAFHLVRRFSEAVIASVGTDGIDGPTDAAGALVDTDTAARAAEHGLHRPEHYLAANDSYTFFEALDDLILTGPTDTNVGDLQVALIG